MMRYIVYVIPIVIKIVLDCFIHICWSCWKNILNCALLWQLIEENGEEHDKEEQNGEEGSQEEAVVVDAESTDGAVLVNGNEAEEAEEEWGTNNEGAPSA